MNIKGIFIFKADSGITLYSKRELDVHEDLLSAFMSAIREFFKSLSLGGLSSFSTDMYVFYYASVNNIATVVIVEQENKSDKYFNLCYKIGSSFYYKFKKFVSSDSIIFIPGVEEFDLDVIDILANFESIPDKQSELIKLFKVNKSSELENFNFIDDHQLSMMDLFVAVNMVNKRIYIVENAESNVPPRLLYTANREANNMNQREFKSEFDINNLSDTMDFDRIVGVINNVLGGVAIQI